MRDYSKFGPRFWTGETGKNLRKMGRDAQVIGVYVFTCPMANMIGLYYLNLPTLCHETGIDESTARHVLARLGEDPRKALGSPFEGVYARFDERSETIFVTEMARHQIGEHLTRRDNRHKAVVKELEQYRKSPFFNDFLARYRADFELDDVTPNKPLPSPLQAPSKPEAGAGAESGAEARTETGARERGARSDVSRGTEANTPSPQTGGVIPYGSNLTKSAEEIHGGMLEDWRRDVPDANAVAFTKWIAHKEGHGHRMGPQQRLIQARGLALIGDAAEQAEVVEFCIGYPYYQFIPLADVRSRSQARSGSGRSGAPARTPEQRESEELKTLRARRKGEWSHGISMSDFREPQTGETSDSYRAAMDREFSERLNAKLRRAAGGSSRAEGAQ